MSKKKTDIEDEMAERLLDQMGVLLHHALERLLTISLYDSCGDDFDKAKKEAKEEVSRAFDEVVERTGWVSSKGTVSTTGGAAYMMFTALEVFVEQQRDGFKERLDEE